MVGFWCCCTTQTTYDVGPYTTKTMLYVPNSAPTAYEDYTTGGNGYAQYVKWRDGFGNPTFGYGESVGHLYWSEAGGTIFDDSDLNISQGTTITSAKIYRVVGNGAMVDRYVGSNVWPVPSTFTVKLRIYGEDNDNKDETPTTNSGFDALPRTTAYTDVQENYSTPFGSSGANYIDDIDVTDIVQEIVNRSGWTSGNHIGFFIEDNGSTNSGTSYYPRSDLYYTAFCNITGLLQSWRLRVVV